MPPLNLSASQFVFTLNGQDWTRYVSPEGISVTQSEYQIESGLVLTDVKLKLIFKANDANPPSGINPRINRAYWGRGAIATISVRGTPLPCSGNRLYILTPPQAPYSETPGGNLTLDLQLGCELTYQNFSEPVSIDETGIVPGVFTSREIAVAAILQRRNIPVFFQTPFAYPLNFAVASTVKSETPVQLAGSLAASSGNFLYCRTDGTVISSVVKTALSGTPIATLDYSLTGNVQAFKPFGNLSEVPVDRLILTGIFNKLTAISTTPTTETVINQATLGSLFPNTPSNLQGITVTSRVTETITSPSENKVTVTVSEPLGILFPDTPSNLGTILVTASVTEVKIFYDSQFRYRGKQSLKRSPQGILFPDTPSNLGTILVTAENIEENVIYNDNTINQITKNIERPLGILFPETPRNLRTILVAAERSSETWVKKRNKGYDYNLEVRRPQGLIFPDTPANLQTILILDSQNSISNGQNTPPPLERKESENLFTEVPLTANVFSDYGATGARARTRTVAVDHVVSVEQLENFGKLFNKLLIGRSQGWIVVARLDNIFLTDAFAPFCQINVTANGYRYFLKVDAITYSLTQKESFVAFNGIEVGIQQLPIPPRPPRPPSPPTPQNPAGDPGDPGFAGQGEGDIIPPLTETIPISGNMTAPAKRMAFNRVLVFSQMIAPEKTMAIGFLGIGGATLVLSGLSMVAPEKTTAIGALRLVDIPTAEIEFVYY
jgi:hypothetical protein